MIEAKGTNKYIIRIDDNGLFDYLAINDSIVKRLGEDEVIVFRNLKPKAFVGTDLYLNLD